MPRDLPHPTAHQIAQASGPGSALPIGKVDTVTGTVTAQHVDGSTVTLAAGDAVYQKDLIASQAGAKIALVFADKTTFALGESGQLRLDELVYDPAGKTGKMGLSMLKGAFAFVSGDIAGKEADAMTVRTPVGTIGIRGTAVEGSIDPSGGGSFVAAVPDPSGAPSIIAFTNAAGTRIFSENSMISVQSFFTAPSAPFSTVGQNLGEAGDLGFTAGAIAQTVNPGGSSQGGPAGGGALPQAPGAGAPADVGPQIVHVLATGVNRDVLNQAINNLTLPQQQIDHTVGLTPPPPPPPPPPHPHFDNELVVTAQGFVGRADQPNHFVGTPGADVFDFATNHNSLKSGDFVDGRGGDDTLNAVFDKPFSITSALTITNVPHINLKLGGGPSNLDALNITSGFSGPSTITATGNGALTVTDLRVKFDAHAVTDAINLSVIGHGLSIVGGGGGDTIVSAAGPDTVPANTIAGGAGNNLLIGTVGTTSHQGIDTVDYSRASGRVEVDFVHGRALHDVGRTDTISGFDGVIGNGNTTVDMTANAFVHVSNVQTVHGNGGGGDVLALDTPSTITIDHVAILVGSTGNDAITNADVSNGTRNLGILALGGGGNDTYTALNAGHTDILNGFSAVHYLNRDDPTGANGDVVTLSGIPAGGTAIDFAPASSGHNILLMASSGVVTVSGGDTIGAAPGTFGLTTNVVMTSLGSSFDVDFSPDHGPGNHTLSLALPGAHTLTLGSAEGIGPVLNVQTLRLLDGGGSSYHLTLDNSVPGLTVDATAIPGRLNLNLIHEPATHAFTVMGSGDTISDSLAPLTVIGANDTVTTGNFNDAIAVFGNNDAVSAGNGNDTITMSGNNDLVSTGNGNGTIAVSGNSDSVSVGNGNNTIAASGNNDSVSVGNGNDRFSFSGTSDSLTAGNGNDTVAVSGTGDRLSLGNGCNQLSVFGGGTSLAVTIGGGGTDTITMFDSNQAVALTASHTDFILDVRGANDVVTASSDTNTIELRGSHQAVTIFTLIGPGIDTITVGGCLGGGFDTVIVGGNANTNIATGLFSAGHDFISVAGGNDTIGDDTTSGFDTIVAGNGNDSIRAGSFHDSVTAGNGNDTISVSGGSGTVSAGSGNDSITIAGSADFLSVGVAGVGTDRITVSGASDTVVAAGGHATIQVNGPNDVISVVAGSNSIVGAGSADVLSYAGASTAVTVNLSTHLATHGGFTDTISGSSFTQVVGSAFNDVITTVDNTVLVTGGGGADTIHLAGVASDNITLHGVTQVDVIHAASSCNVTVDLLGQAQVFHAGFGPGYSFDLSGAGGAPHLTFNLIGPTSLDFFDVAGKGVGGTTFLHGVQSLTLQGGSYNLGFEGSFPSLTMIDGHTLGAASPLAFSDNGFGNLFDVRPGLGADTLHGTATDTLDYSQSGAPVTLTLTGFDSFPGGVSGTGAGGTAAGDVFTHFGNLVAGPSGSGLVIAAGSGLAHGDTIDLNSKITYHFGCDTVGISGFTSVVNQTGLGLHITGNGSHDTITGGVGADTLTAHAGGFDNFNYLATTDSFSNANPNLAPAVDSHTDVILTFQNSGSTLDFHAMAGVGTQTFAGSRTGSTFANSFGSDHAGDVDFAVLGGNTYVHVATHSGYAVGDLLIQIQGNHPLTAANFHLHA